MKRWLGRLIALLCGFLLLLISVLYQGPVSGTREWLRILSNAALVPGILFFGIGAIVRISEEGLFDGIRYATSSLFAHLRREKKRYDSYYDYTQRKKKKSAALSLLLPGLFFLAAAIVLTLLYYLL